MARYTEVFADTMRADNRLCLAGMLGAVPVYPGLTHDQVKRAMARKDEPSYMGKDMDLFRRQTSVRSRRDPNGLS